MRYRTLALFPVLALAACAACAAGALPEDLQEDLNEDGRGIISDYSNLQAGDDINWYWIAPGVSLAKHRCKLGSYKNMTDEIDEDIDEVLREDFPGVLDKACATQAGAPALTLDTAVYWAQEANAGKAWIPFSGGYLAQAGIGVEILFKNASGKVVAKIRQAARQGSDIDDAAEEVTEDVAEFIAKH